MSIESLTSRYFTGTRAGFGCAVMLLVSSPVAAQTSGDGFLFSAPKGSVTIRGGFTQARAASDLFDFFISELTLNRRDFGSATLAGDVDVHINRRIAIVANFAYGRSKAESEFRHFAETVGDDTDVPIRQTTELSRMPITVGVKAYFLPEGRPIGRLAWVPARYAVFVGTAAGPMRYVLKQQGDFVDFDTLRIFPDFFESTAVRPTVPVVENGKAVGILSARLLMSHRAGHLNQQVEERTHELQRLTGELLDRERQAERSLKVAGRLMNRLLLPGAPPDWPELNWAVHYRPLDPLGGDYYDFAQPDGRHLGVLIADASGHSLPAAMVAIMARIAFAEASRDTTSPSTVLRGMNQRLLELTDERFVSAFYGVYDRVQRRFNYCSAGHPAPLHYEARTRIVRPLTSRGLLLGILPEADYVELTIDLAPGDRLCLFTDGLTETPGAGGEPFGTARLEAALATAGSPAGAALRRLHAALAEFRGDRPATDDETLLVGEVRG